VTCWQQLPHQLLIFSHVGDFRAIAICRGLIERGPRAIGRVCATVTKVVAISKGEEAKVKLRGACMAFVVGLAAVTLAGAADESGGGAVANASQQYWAYRPVTLPNVPKVKHNKWVRSPIDAFVLAEIEGAGLEPSKEAERAAFVRRATLDTWGLIPTPDEVKAFEHDHSSQAYEHLVDRLLASPRYGERQARHWLDLARYADSAGFQGDELRPTMWRYRDYVINSFNEDKPYDRFIKEQIAGDEIFPGDESALIATGFLRSYPDNSNSRDLVQKKYQHTTDMTDTVGEVFLAQTVGCARCHNHKSDKISQKDYYSLQAFFANTSASDDIPAHKGDFEQAYLKQRAEFQDSIKSIRAEQKAIIDSVRDKAKRYLLERYSQQTQVSLHKIYSTPEDQWTAHDRWIIHRFKDYEKDSVLSAYLHDHSSPGAEGYDPSYAAKYERYKELDEQVKKFEKLRPQGSDKLSAMTELGHAEAPPTYVLFGGDFEKPKDEVQPAFPAAITSEKPDIHPSATSSGRRAALADWIASPGNPLSARVFVNRVWSWYFDKGIVATVSDFGKAGKRPDNPELLDYLAATFVQQGWSVKKLQREILLSSVYRQSSAYRPEIAKADPDNKLLAVFPRQRLDAEEIRDSLLVASGQIDNTVGGPGVFPPVPKNFSGGGAWRVSENPQDWNRRSIYIFTRRSLPYPLLSPFDMASAEQAHARRDVTTTALQALTLLNSPTVFDWSRALADRVVKEAGSNDARRLERLYQVLFGRSPDKQEKADLLAFLGDQENRLPRDAAFVDLVHAVANTNDFVYRF
jgi:hypothetical protein